MDFMKDKPDNFYDLAIVDPPYGILEKMKNKNKIKISKGNKFIIKYAEKNWDKKPDSEYFQELFRISKNQIICGANYFCNFIPISKGWIVWDKKGGKMSSVNTELIWSSFDISIKIFSRCHGLDKGFMRKDGGLIHPIQKPVALYKWLLKNYAKPGQTIFDSHVGSGSIRIACHDLGFDFTGCENDADYWQAQEDRFQTHIEQGDLFDKQEYQEIIYNQENLL